MNWTKNRIAFDDLPEPEWDEADDYTPIAGSVLSVFITAAICLVMIAVYKAINP